MQLQQGKKHWQRPRLSGWVGAGVGAGVYLEVRVTSYFYTHRSNCNGLLI